MDLKQYIKKTLEDIISSVDGINETSKRKVRFYSNQEHRTVDFDIATSVVNEDSKGLGGEIKVLGMQFGSDGSSLNNNAQISRIKFSLDIESDDNIDFREAQKAQRAHMSNRKHSNESK